MCQRDSEHALPYASDIINDIEQNMTSGDESDNEDSSDGYSTDSDWSDYRGGRSLLVFVERYYS